MLTLILTFILFFCGFTYDMLVGVFSGILILAYENIEKKKKIINFITKIESFMNRKVLKALSKKI